jgi:hypothetical protein
MSAQDSEIIDLYIAPTYIFQAVHLTQRQLQSLNHPAQLPLGRALYGLKLTVPQ